MRIFKRGLTLTLFIVPVCISVSWEQGEALLGNITEEGLRIR